MTSQPLLRVAVFGASGGIGRLVVDQLLGAGHTVTAYVRNPGKLTVTHPNLTVVQGELDDDAAIVRAVARADAVISALGPSLDRGATGTPVTNGTSRILQAMKAAGVRRFIALATPAIADPRDGWSFTGMLLQTLTPFTLAHAFKDLVGMHNAVTASDLDWTLARITQPTDDAPKGTIRAGFLGKDSVGWATTRADIAAFLVGQLADDRFLRAAPAISN